MSNKKKPTNRHLGKFIGSYIPHELAKELQKLAEKHRRSVSRQVLVALEEQMEREKSK